MKIKKALWFAAGIIFLGIAFVGIYMPMLPWSTPTVIAAYCFAKSSKRMHDYLFSHKLFGPFLIGWTEKRIFPTKFKYFMIITMASSLAMLWFTTYNVDAVLYSGIFMLLVAIWGWRYPGSEAEHAKRKKLGKRIAWLS
jgi:uncharacterized membrane protein YbaN (DUF454 family)